MTDKSATGKMTEREITQLLRLLDKFRLSTERDGTTLNVREQAVVRLVHQWAIWYGHDELGMDLR